MRKKQLIIYAVATAAVAMLMAACSPEPTDRAGGGEEQDPVGGAESLAWSTGSECSVCHVGESTSQTDPSCPLSAHPALSCIDCHADVDGLAAAHGEVTYADTDGANRLKTTAVASETCTAAGCHLSEDLTSSGESSTLLVDDYGTVVNPHAVREMNESHSGIQCADCHGMHSSAGIEETAPGTCLSCHHAGVYECGTCHEV